MNYSYKPMVTVELSEELYEKMCNLISIDVIDEIKPTYVLNTKLYNELTTIGITQPVPTKTEEELFYYMFATKNFKRAPIKYYRVILEDDGEVCQYFYINEEGRISIGNSKDRIPKLTMKQIPERFKPFAQEV